MAAPGWNALVDRLIADGIARPDPLRLGFDLDRHGAVVDVTGTASGRVYAIGASRRGTRWEAAAIPEIRRHASDLAAQLLGPAAASELGDSGLAEARQA